MKTKILILIFVLVIINVVLGIDITIISPIQYENYNASQIWMNVSLNENGSGCRYYLYNTSNYDDTPLSGSPQEMERLRAAVRILIEYLLERAPLNDQDETRTEAEDEPATEPQTVPLRLDR